MPRQDTSDFTDSSKENSWLDSERNARNTWLDSERNARNTFLESERNASNRNSGLYKGTGKVTSKGSSSFFQRKKQMAVLGILGLLGFGGIGLLAGSSHMMLMPAIETLLTEATDTQYASSSLRNQVLKGARSRRVNGLFDKAADKFFSRIGISRNHFRNTQSSIDEDTAKRQLRSIMDDKLEGSDITAQTRGYKEEDELDENNQATGNKIETPESDAVDASNVSGDSPRTRASSFANSFVSGVQKAADTLNIPCIAFQVATMISGTIAAYEVYKTIDYAMTYLENFSKTRSGDGVYAFANTVLNDLTTTHTATVDDYANYRSYSGSEEIGETSLTGAATQSEGLYSILTSTTANPDKTINYSYGRSMPALLERFAQFGTINGLTLKTCAAAQGLESIATLAVSFMAGGGIGKIIGSFFTKSAAGTILLSAGIGALLSFVIPTLAKVLFTNYMENALGISAGEYLARGTASVNTLVGQAGSAQMPASKDYVIAYNRVNNQVLAMDAEDDRKNRSPFDIGSKNTFFGSIFYSFVPSLLVPNKFSALTTFTNTAKTSISNIISNGVYADGEGSTFITTFGDEEICKQSTEVGASSNIYCYEERITDPTTIDMSYDEVKNKIIDLGGLECSGDECEVVKNSNLAHFVNFCKNRYSPFGTLDQNIVDSFSVASGTVGTILSHIPILDEVENILSTGNQLLSGAYEWGSGENCVISEENDLWDEELKYYQRYIEDERLLERESMDSEEESEESTNPITKFEEEYALAHPIEDSPAGYLSTIAGITLDQADLIITLAEYNDFVSNYDVASRELFKDLTTAYSGDEIVAQIEDSRTHLDIHAFGTNGLPATDSNFRKDRRNHEKIDPTAIIAFTLVYADLRGRTYTV